MKQIKLFLTTAIAATVLLTACSNEPKLLSEAEVAQKVAEATATKTKELETKLDAECTANMDNMVNTAVDSILMAKKSENALSSVKK
jgi:outer membrane murein-binding lipoprotein Lpp